MPSGKDVQTILQRTTLLEMFTAAHTETNGRVAASWTNERGETMVVVCAVDKPSVQAGTELVKLLAPLDERDGVQAVPVESKHIITDTRAMPAEPGFKVERDRS